MTDRYAVIGNPISHSKSPWIHTQFAQMAQQAMVYTAIEGRLDQFEEDVTTFATQGGRGLNVTIPFKERAFAMATHRSERAATAGAVNALKLENGEILAENFDGVGLMRDVQSNLGFSLKNKRVLVLGAGGATRGMLQPLSACAPAYVLVANRTPERAHRLQKELGHLGPIEACGWTEITGMFDVVFNATAASLGGMLPPLPDHLLAPDGLAYDLVYGKGRTAFLKWALETAPGCRRADGVGMLVEQAAEAFAWWRGVRPDTQTLIKTMSTTPI